MVYQLESVSASATLCENANTKKWNKHEKPDTVPKMQCPTNKTAGISSIHFFKRTAFLINFERFVNNTISLVFQWP
jgi:hypothetical protein